MNSPLPLTEASIQIRRTPSELVSWVTEVRRSINDDPIERKKARLNQGIYKQFIEEVQPLSEFCQFRFDETFTVIPKIGNQQFDAEVFSPDSTLAFRIELTMPHNGNCENKDTISSMNRGYGSTQIHKTGEEVSKLTEYITQTAKKKANKPYQGCILVFALRALAPMAELQRQHQAAEDIIAQIISTYSFSSNEVWLLCADKRVLKIHG